MIKTITGIYDTLDKIRNAREELIVAGIEQEKLFVDGSSRKLKIIVPADIEPEIVEILSRHEPSKIDVH